MHISGAGHNSVIKITEVHMKLGQNNPPECEGFCVYVFFYYIHLVACYLQWEGGIHVEVFSKEHLGKERGIKTEMVFCFLSGFL